MVVQMHILFLLLPKFGFQIHDIGVRERIQGRELFGDTGKQERWLSTLWCRVAGSSVQVLAAAWLRDDHTWGCVAGLWFVGPTRGTLYMCMRHWEVITVMPTWSSTNSFRRDRWDGWVVVAEFKWSTSREGRLRDVEYVDTKSGIHPSLKERS